MLTHDALKRDVARRIERIQAMMQAKDLGALIVVGQAQPGGIGAIRYITHAHIWGGAAYAVLGATDPHPWLTVWSSYQSMWSRNETTTLPDRVESPDNIVARTTDLAKGYATSSKRIGMVNMNKLMSIGEYGKFTKALEGYELVEVTADYDALRQIKSPFELGYIKSFGGFWGRTKVALDLSPYTIPTPKDQRMTEDDIMNFEIVYESPWGYWLEMTSVFSFKPLPADVQAMYDGYLLAVEQSAAVAKTGNTFRIISDTNDKTLRDLGFNVIGKHTPDCHSTGLDGSDGPSTQSNPDFVLKSNMVLSFHPGTILENQRGFLITDNFLVTPEGAVRLSPHNANRYYMQLEP
jgi:Xaa-Pro aminopeptidase